MALRSGVGARLSLLAACVAWGAAAQAATSAGTVTVSATVPSKNVCKLSTTNALALDFLSIDPSSALSVTRQLSWTFTCNGASPAAVWAMTAGDGLYPEGAGLRRMRHGTVPTAFLPYVLGISPAAGTAAKGVAVTVTITGTVLPSSFQPALAGSYSDTVAITVSP